MVGTVNVWRQEVEEAGNRQGVLEAWDSAVLCAGSRRRGRRGMQVGGRCCGEGVVGEAVQGYLECGM